MGANNETVKEPVAQLPWEPSLVEEAGEGEIHGGHGLEAFRVLEQVEQVVEVVRTARDVLLLRDGLGPLDSCSAAYGGRLENCAVAVEAEAEGALTCSEVIQSKF